MKVILGAIYEKTGGYMYVVPMLHICLLYAEVVLPWKFGNSGFN